MTGPDTVGFQATVRILVYSKASQEEFQQGVSSPGFHFRRITLISGLRTRRRVCGDIENQLGGYCSDSGEGSWRLHLDQRVVIRGKGAETIWKVGPQCLLLERTCCVRKRGVGDDAWIFYLST